MFLLFVIEVFIRRPFAMFHHVIEHVVNIIADWRVLMEVLSSLGVIFVTLLLATLRPPVLLQSLLLFLFRVLVSLSLFVAVAVSNNVVPSTCDGTVPTIVDAFVFPSLLVELLICLLRK